MYSGAYVTELVLRCHQFEKRMALSLGLSVEETHCLSQLFLHTPSCVKKLTALLGVSSTRMSRILRRLERKGLIMRRASPLDHRVEHVSLTVVGSGVVTKLMEMLEVSRNEIFDGLPSGEYVPSRSGPEEEFTGE